MFSDAINPGPQHDVDYSKGSAVANWPWRAQANHFQLELAGLILVSDTARLPNLPCTGLARGCEQVEKSPDDPNYGFGPVNTCLYVRDTWDWWLGHLPRNGRGRRPIQIFANSIFFPQKPHFLRFFRIDTLNVEKEGKKSFFAGKRCW